MIRLVLLSLALLGFSLPALAQSAPDPACRQMLGAALGRELDALTLINTLKAEIEQLKHDKKAADPPKK